MADFEMDIEEESQVRHVGSWGESDYKTRTMKITAWVSVERLRGGFEIYDLETQGDEFYGEGGLWFNEQGEMVDYDGVYSLDYRIREWLESIQEEFVSMIGDDDNE